MESLTFYFASMDSGKSMEAIRRIHSFENQNKRCLALTSQLDNRYGIGVIASRAGISKTALCISTDTNIYELVLDDIRSNPEKLYKVFIDECQFLTKDQVIQLAQVVDELNIPISCYGLKNTFMNTLFEGSAALLVYADEIKEIEGNTCTVDNCDRHATMVVRLIDGVPTYDGDVIQIGGNKDYASVCRKHYSNYPVKEEICI
ncbi:thymidine kinase [Paenibacillus pabuli]|uniref:thymidine kinase n=1 Tax=Paenibacillus pabuli TaxID=1472 RepID=UPI003241F517